MQTSLHHGIFLECGRLLIRICHNWFLKSSGVTGCMNAPGHLLDFQRSYSDLAKINSLVFIPSGIYIQRVKCYLSKKIKSDWTEFWSADYQNSISCWAKLEELQRIIPYYSEKWKQIILIASWLFTSITAHNLSYVTTFIVAALFCMVKASRPVTYQFLVVQSIESIGESLIKLSSKQKKSMDLIRWYFETMYLLW